MAAPADILTSVVPMLHAYEGRTWGQIVAGPRHIHFIDVARIVRDAQKRLAEVWEEDLPEQLLSFAVGNVPRVWGVRQGDVFQLVWWDPKHQIYPTEPRDT